MAPDPLISPTFPKTRNNLLFRMPSSHSSSRLLAPPMVGLPLLPHPIPNPTPMSVGGLPSNTGVRRPQTPSIESMYPATQPPSKRFRGSREDQQAREPRSSYSDTVSLQFFKICLFDRFTDSTLSSISFILLLFRYSRVIPFVKLRN